MSTLTDERTDPAPRRVTLGFTGGLTVSRRMTAAQLADLRAAMDDDATWCELRTEQETLVVSLSELAYVEADETGRRIGFD